MLINAINDYFDNGFTVVPVRLRLNKKGKKDALFGVMWRDDDNITKERIVDLVKRSVSGYESSKTGENFKIQYNSLGLLTGQASNLLVLDVDVGGVNGFDTLRDEGIVMPPNTPNVKTQSGGRHFYFTFPEELKGFATTKSFGADYHIDIRGDGGLVFVPPSKIDSKNFYSWIIPLDSGVPDPPEKLIKFILEHSNKKIKAVGTVPEIKFKNDLGDEYKFVKNACDCLAGNLNNYDDWVKVGQALSSMGEEGRSYWHFVSSNPKYNDSLDEIDRKFDNFLKTTHSVSIASLFQVAKNSGFEYPKSEKPPAADPKNRDLEQEYFENLSSDKPQEEKSLDIDNVLEAAWRSEKGLAELLMVKMKKKFLYAPNSGQKGDWLIYRDGRWQIDFSNSVFLFVSDNAEKILTNAIIELRKRKDEELLLIIKMLVKLRNKIYCVAFVKSLVSWLQALLPTNINHFDEDLTIINLKNGIYNLETGELKPHNPKYKMMRQAPVNYDPNAKCPFWEKLMQTIILDDDLETDEDTIRTLQQWFGLCLSAEIQEQYFLYCFGTGANGKSTLLSAVYEILGKPSNGGYSASAPSDIFTFKYNGNKDAMRVFAELLGVRFLLCDEIESQRMLSEKDIKSISSGQEEITGERKFERQFSYDPTAKANLFGNYKLRVKVNNIGVTRRMLLVKFNHVFAGSELLSNTVVKAKIKAEFSGILNWLIAGYNDHKEYGFKVSKTILENVGEYRDDQDQFLHFYDEICKEDKNVMMRYEILYKEYDNWIKDNGEKPYFAGKNKLVAHIKQRAKDFKLDFSAIRGTNWIRGITFKDKILEIDHQDQIKYIDSQCDNSACLFGED